jgi:hypothetical protein
MLLDIYGLRIKCLADSPQLAASLIRPFNSYRVDKGEPAITISIKQENCPSGIFLDAESRYSTPRNIVFKGKDGKLIDYFGKGAVIKRDHEDTYYIYGKESNFLIETFYLLVLSLWGQFCDKKGLLRIHALGLSYGERAFLFLLPPGGGKSTTAIAMLKEDGFKLISDDEPLYDGDGFMHPFHIRIGVLDRKSIPEIPDQYVYQIDRMEFGPKSFVDCEYWKERLETKPIKDIVMFTARLKLGGRNEIRPISKFRVFKTLLRDAVVGIGLYQGVEFLFSSSNSEILFKIPLFFRRLTRALALSWRAKGYELTLVRASGGNAAFVSEAIRNLS